MRPGVGDASQPNRWRPAMYEGCSCEDCERIRAEEAKELIQKVLAVILGILSILAIWYSLVLG